MFKIGRVKRRFLVKDLRILDLEDLVEAKTIFTFIILSIEVRVVLTIKVILSLFVGSIMKLFILTRKGFSLYV